MSFYSDVNTEPKRPNRFLLYLTPIDTYVIKSVDKPSFSVSKAEHKFGQHTFKWPGSVTWEDINVSLIDAVNPDSTTKLVNALVAAGYKPPTSYSNSLTFLSKAKTVVAIGTPRIVQLDADQNQLEEWVLHNAFIVSAKFGNLSYDDGDKLLDISMTISFDYPTMTSFGQPASELK